MTDGPPPAVADGGPLDGSIIAAAAGPAEFEVVMQDDSRWRYVRTDGWTTSAGRPAQVYRCAGRIMG